MWLAIWGIDAQSKIPAGIFYPELHRRWSVGLRAKSIFNGQRTDVNPTIAFPWVQKPRFQGPPSNASYSPLAGSGQLGSGFFPTAPCLLVYPTYCGSPIPPGIEEYAITSWRSRPPKTSRLPFVAWSIRVARDLLCMISWYQEIISKIAKLKILP
jgi:hypothetical protein